jgi:myosin heavy subunit
MASGTLVYVPDEALTWAPAELVSQTEGGVVVRLHTVDGRLRSNGEPYELNKDTEIVLQNTGPDGSPDNSPVPDLTTLGHLHEASILYSLRSRHEKLIPYT